MFSTLPPIINEVILSIILGIVQGITEFLPISSTAHLLLVSKFLVGKDIGLTTSNVIQFGTLVAIISYYYQDLKVLSFRLFNIITSPSQAKIFFKHVNSWLSSNYENEAEKDFDSDVTLVQIIIATVPVIIAALLLRNQIESLRGNLNNVALFLILGGVLVSVAEIIHKFYLRQHKTEIMGKLEVLVIGIFQCFSIFPGVSRSGATLSGALALGRNRNQSVRFSFLLAVPALALASTYDLIKVINEVIKGQVSLFPVNQLSNQGTIQISVFSLLIGFLVAYFVGLASLKWLLRYLGRHDSRYFVIYRLVLAAIILFGLIK